MVRGSDCGDNLACEALPSAGKPAVVTELETCRIIPTRPVLKRRLNHIWKYVNVALAPADTTI